MQSYELFKELYGLGLQGDIGKRRELYDAVLAALERDMLILRILQDKHTPRMSVQEAYRKIAAHRVSKRYERMTQDEINAFMQRARDIRKAKHVYSTNPQAVKMRAYRQRRKEREQQEA